MTSRFDALRRMSLGPLVGRFVLMGAAAGVAAWALVWVLSPRFNVARPNAAILGSAIARGAIVGGALAVILNRYWRRSGS